MKLILIFACVIASILAAPADPLKDQAVILKFDNDNNGIGQYNFNVETSDGISRQEQGELKNVGTDQESIAVRGSYSYVVDGITYTVNYIADENGFRPEGAHIAKGTQ